jgi:hypothetical protein
VEQAGTIDAGSRLINAAPLIEAEPLVPPDGRRDR